METASDILKKTSRNNSCFLFLFTVCRVKAVRAVDQDTSNRKLPLTWRKLPLTRFLYDNLTLNQFPANIFRKNWNSGSSHFYNPERTFSDYCTGAICFQLKHCIKFCCRGLSGQWLKIQCQPVQLDCLSHFLHYIAKPNGFQPSSEQSH